MTPIYKIEADNKDITAAIKDYLASFRITDAKGYESDSFEMVLTDPNAEIPFPPSGKKLKVWIGFKHTGLVYKGEYVTDEPEFSGPPDKFTIKARAADMNGGLKSQKTRSFHDSKLGGIIQYIADGNGLKAAISDRFKNIIVQHIDQTNESDLHFLTRLGKKYDATAKVANGYVIFTENGTTKTASGDDMPEFTLNIDETDGYNFSRSGKSEFTGVAALWHSFKSSELHQELAGEKGNLKTIKRHFPSQQEAKNAADAEFKRLQRDKDTASIAVKMGKPEYQAECKFTLVGWRPDIDTEWVSKEVTFNFSKSGGLTTDLELEKLQSTENNDEWVNDIKPVQVK